MKHETLLSGKDLPALVRALERMRIHPESAVWFHNRDTPEGGWPVDFEAVEEGSGLTVSVRREGTSSDANEVAARIRVSVPYEDDAQATPAALLIRRILACFHEERRMECAGLEPFLGYPNHFAWTEETLPVALLPSIHSFLEKDLAGWRRLKAVRPKNSREVRQQVLRDSKGQKVTVYSDVRFYMHKDDQWLVLELSTNDAATTLSLASSGTPMGWEAEFLARLERAMKSGVALQALKISASGEGLELERTYSWDELFLAESTKRLIIDETLGFFDREALYRQMDLPYRRGVLLHGAPGTGKTLVGKILASSLGNCAFIWVTARHVSSGQSVATIFSLARYASRVVLFFEDLDFYASERTYYQGASSNLGELLVQLDGMHSNHGTLVIATTNDLSAIEPALKERPSRFDRVVELAPAPSDVRQAHLLKLLSPYGVTTDDLQSVIKKSDGFTGAQLQELAVRARMLAADRGDDRVRADDLVDASRIAAAYRSSASPIGFGASDSQQSYAALVDGTRSDT